MTARGLLLLLALWTCAPTWGAGALSEATWKRLNAIQEQMAAGDNRKAVAALQRLAERTRANPYEYANVMQTLGYAWSALERYDKAAEAFRAALATEALPDGVMQAMRYDLAQLLALQGRWAAALKVYRRWLANEKAPSAESYLLGATLYSELERYPAAIEALRKAIALAKRPRKAWYQMLLGLYHQAKQPRNALKLLQRMVALWPGEGRYWKQLSALHYQLGQHRQALVTLALAYRQGHLSKERELLNLVNLYLLQKIPYKAARIMEREIEKGRIRPTGRHLRQLGEAWMAARETEKAIGALQRAAERLGEGPLYLRLARLQYDRGRWREVIRQARAARRAGGLKNPGTAWLLEGMAHHELGREEQAKAAFRKALDYPKSRSQAQQWLNFLGNF